MALPWRMDTSILPSNYSLVFNRLKCLQRKFFTDQLFCENYTAVILDQQDRGFIERVYEDKPKFDQCHYLAHCGVLKYSRTTPVRVVFNCSAKLCKNSPSLNECLYTGSSLISELL